ncbi:RNA polymerase I enhancer binding protein [Dipsacomyces acuminosporus]|nr:RNA polymerase I enhancer binding protein [Dipsacomyces acuminosporus]
MTEASSAAASVGSLETSVPLVELLQAYPGLLSDRVEVVARALAQATMAAADTAGVNGAGVSASALQRIQWGKASLPLRSGFQANAPRYQAPSTDAGNGNAQQEDPTAATAALIRRARASNRRWFTQEHLQQLQREGIVFTKGKFTDEENAVIDRTITGFIETHGLGRPELYDHLFRRKPRDAEGKQLRKIFWPLIAEALPTRQIQAIYHHVRRKYHPHNYQGAWTPAEDDELRRLVAVHGPSWEAISEQLGRMGTNCRDRWRYIHGVTRGQQATATANSNSNSSSSTT